MAKSISKCYKAYLKNSNPLHCQISDKCRGWGCKHLLSIAHENSCVASKYWYEFGCFENGKFEKWIIDKPELTSALQKEIDLHYLYQCPKFNINDVLGIIDILEDEIIIDNVCWTLLENSETKEIIGISHLEDMNFNFDSQNLISSTDWDNLSSGNTPKYTSQKKRLSLSFF